MTDALARFASLPIQRLSVGHWRDQQEAPYCAILLRDGREVSILGAADESWQHVMARAVTQVLSKEMP